MAILTFHASTEDREALSKLKCPFQIMPGGRSTLTTEGVLSFNEMSNPNVLIHSSYITRPFATEIKGYTTLNLINYAELAKRLGTKHVLIHLPDSVNTYSNYSKGIATIIEHLVSKGCICHLETTALCKDLQKHLTITPESAVKTYTRFVDELFSIIPVKYKESFRLVPDTAHLFVNGFRGSDMLTFIKNHATIIDFIHLNGNRTAMFARDKHTPLYNTTNRIPDTDTLMKYLAKEHFILITENTDRDEAIPASTEAWEQWKAFASKYKLSLVPFSKVWSL